MGKKLYSIPEIYKISFNAFRSAGRLKRGKKKEIIDDKLQERIMLAVTAVNNCPMCSYAHTEMALKAGLSKEEIKVFTEGEFPDLPENEIKAVLFAQHYADQRGNPSKEAWENLIMEYNEAKAETVLAATRIIMFGNAVGIVFSSLKGRIKKTGADTRSNLLYEIIVLFSLLILIPMSILHAFFYNLINRPFIYFR